MQPYDGLSLYFGDLHNHCGMSYGKGSLDRALENARQQLDFCSVTGHALWPDMPPRDGQIDYIIDFHEEGFARLRACWQDCLKTFEQHNDEGTFVTFPSFECHGSGHGDYTILFGRGEADIWEVGSFAELRSRVLAAQADGVPVIAFPHHTGYRRGYRGINWESFDPAVSPLVEMLSMHGCSECDETPRPYLHTMGPLDHGGTIRHGLRLGKRFGLIGSTDHHSAHPGSYGHGRTGLWARGLTREAIWEALLARRTYALTGDRIELAATLNGLPMGSDVPRAESYRLEARIVGGAPIDYVELIRDGRAVQRISATDRPGRCHEPASRTKIFIEVGWGARGRRQDWDVTLELVGGTLHGIEPRFRGPEVVSPLEEDAVESTPPCQAWRDGNRAGFTATTFGNPNNVTPATQGICLDVDAPDDAELRAEFNGLSYTARLADLRGGARADRLGGDDSGAFRFHRAAAWEELAWSIELDDTPTDPADVRNYYLRVRQANDQWAWASPWFIAD